MSCDACEDPDRQVLLPIRVGDESVGWGNVLIVGCEAHARLAYEQWRGGARFTNFPYDAMEVLTHLLDPQGDQ